MMGIIKGIYLKFDSIKTTTIKMLSSTIRGERVEHYGLHSKPKVDDNSWTVVSNNVRSLSKPLLHGDGGITPPMDIEEGETLIYNESVTLYLKSDGTLAISGDVTIEGNVTALDFKTTTGVSLKDSYVIGNLGSPTTPLQPIGATPPPPSNVTADPNTGSIVANGVDLTNHIHISGGSGSPSSPPQN